MPYLSFSPSLEFDYISSSKSFFIISTFWEDFNHPIWNPDLFSSIHFILSKSYCQHKSEQQRVSHSLFFESESPWLILYLLNKKRHLRVGYQKFSDSFYRRWNESHIFCIVFVLVLPIWILLHIQWRFLWIRLVGVIWRFWDELLWFWRN